MPTTPEPEALLAEHERTHPTALTSRDLDKLGDELAGGKPMEKVLRG